MKRLIFCLLTFCMSSIAVGQENVGIGTASPDPSAALDISSSEKGVLIPRLSSTQRVDISNPVEGLMVYDSTTQTFWYYIDDWKEISPYGIFKKENGVVSNIENPIGFGDDFVFGADVLPQNGVNLTERLFFLDASLGAFRAGAVSNSSTWSTDSIGIASFAGGHNSKAKGDYSTSFGNSCQSLGNFSIAMGRSSEARSDDAVALGYLNVAEGFRSFATGSGAKAIGFASTSMGLVTEALGLGSTALGVGTEAGAYRSTALGTYNVGGGNPNSYVSTDPLFEIGNGTDDFNKSNALTILKDGTVSLENYTFPHADGSVNQFMQTDGSGIIGWSSLPTTNTQNINNNAANIFNNSLAINTHTTNDTDLSPTNEIQTLSISGQDLTLSSGNTITLPDDVGVFETNNDVIQYTGSDSHDFTLGLDSMPVNGANYTEDGLFYDASKSALRIGSSFDSQSWSPNNIDHLSVGIGLNTVASGYTSVAMGNYTYSTGYASAAFNHASGASGFAASAFNNATFAKGNHSFSAGSSTRAGAYSSAAFGRYNIGIGDESSWQETDALFEVGNGTSHTNRANALTILKNGTISFENYTFPNADGVANQMLKTDGAGNLDWISIPDDSDADATNELIANFSFNNGSLNITDAGGTLNADITSVKPHTIEDNDADSRIEFNNTSDKILFTTDGNTVVKMESDSMYLNGSLQIGESGQSKLHLGTTFAQVATGTLFSIKNITNSTDDLVIDNQGEVGIGLNNPQEILDIGATGNFDGIRIKGSSNNDNVQLKLDNNSTQGREYAIRSTGSGASQGGGKLLIRDNSAGTSRIAIDNAGRVGIGRTSMDERLHVNGLVKIDGLAGTGTGPINVNPDGVLVRGNHLETVYIDFMDFEPQLQDEIYYHMLEGVYLSDGVGTILGSMSDIPDGATISSVTVHYMDLLTNFSDNMDFQIQYHDGGSGSSSQIHDVGDSFNGVGAKQSTTYDNLNIVLDRSTYHYAFSVNSADWGPSMKVFSVEITFSR